MLDKLAPYLWYAVGSVCFLVGTLLVIIRILRG
jgi:hypothetical protein